MTLLPQTLRRLAGALSLAVVGCLPWAYTSPVLAVELEGTLVPIDSAATQVTDAEDQTRPLPAVPPLEPAAPPSAPVHPKHQSDWEREFEMGLKQAFGEGHGSSGDYKGAFELAVLIPLFAVIFIFGGPIFLICFLIARRYSYRQLRQQSINSNIDKLLAAGRDIPVELLRGDEPKGADDNGTRSKGIRNMCLGTGWAIFLTILAGIDIGAIGFIWIALGVSQVLIWYLNEPKTGLPLAQQVERQD